MQIRVARIKRAVKDDPWSREEIQDLIHQSETDIDADEKSMLSGVLEVSETQVREVMVPRSQMVVIDIDDEFDDTMKLIVESGHSRFPVIGEDRDEVQRRRQAHRDGEEGVRGGPREGPALRRLGDHGDRLDQAGAHQ